MAEGEGLGRDIKGGGTGDRLRDLECDCTLFRNSSCCLLVRSEACSALNCCVNSFAQASICSGSLPCGKLMLKVGRIFKRELDGIKLCAGYAGVEE